jgi:hypothetical protein
MAFFPAGSRSIWHVPQYVLKLGVCRHRLSRPFGYALRAWHKLINIVTGFSDGQEVLQGQPSSGPTGIPARAA